MLTKQPSEGHLSAIIRRTHVDFTLKDNIYTLYLRQFYENKQYDSTFTQCLKRIAQPDPRQCWFNTERMQWMNQKVRQLNDSKY